MQEARTGNEARGGTSPDGPFKQTYGYDVWENTTSRSHRLWTAVTQAERANFTNNKRQYWFYDNEGNLTADFDADYGYDAAGRQNSFVSNVHIGGWPTSYPEQSILEISQTFDGNSSPVKKTTTNRWEELLGEEIHIQQSTATIYFLRSTPLGGQVVAELNATGSKQMGYIFAGGMRIATQQLGNPGFDVIWTSTSPATGSEYMTDIYLGRKELDPLGTDVTYAPAPEVVSEPIFYNPKFDQMPLMIEGGPSEGYERANREWASVMAAAFQAVQDRGRAEQLWQSGRRSEAMAILMKNPNVGIEYRAIYKNEVIRSGSWFGKDAADFLNGINIAVGAGWLTPLTSGMAPSPQKLLIQDDPVTIPSRGSSNCKFTISFQSGTFYEKNPNLPNGPGEIRSQGRTYFGLGFTVEGSTRGGGGIGRIGSQVNPSNPNGQWTLEQYTSSYAKQNGSFVVIEGRAQQGGDAWQDISLAGYHFATDWTNRFSRYDHPALPVNPDTYKNQAFLIKVSKGNEACQAEFHIVQRGNTIHWGRGGQGVWPQ